jgi:hypothetical protein
MRGLRLLNDFAAWRWAPTVALVGGTFFYILFILLLIPTEIGLPGLNAEFSPRRSVLTGAADAGVAFTAGDDDEGAEPAPVTAAATGTALNEPPPQPQPYVPPAAPGAFGNRGFSPPLPREEPAPAPPPAPVPQAPPPVPPPPAAAPAPTGPAAPAPTGQPAAPEVAPGADTPEQGEEQGEAQGEAQDPNTAAEPG